MNIVEQWRERLESKYRLIVNGHDSGEARGGERELRDRIKNSGLLQWVMERIVQYNIHQDDFYAFKML